MIALVKFCFIGSWVYASAQSEQDICIRGLAKRSIGYGDLAIGNDSICKKVDLDPELCRLGLSYAVNEEAKKHLPIPGAGSTPVRLLPYVVIKEVGEDESKRRRELDESALLIIEDNGYDHLIVPSSCIQGDYSINERLPIMNFADSAVLYYEHPEHFTQAVEQFVHFSMRHPLTDIISRIGNPRFDNIVPYLTEENGRWIGKLGLVDLEHFEPSKETSWEMARDIIQFFPHHYHTIISVIQQYHPEWLEQRKEEFQSARNNSIKFFFLYTSRAELENSDIVTKILKEDCSSELINYILPSVAANGFANGVKKLLDQNVISPESRGKALKIAAEEQFTDIVKMLLESGKVSSEHRGESLLFMCPGSSSADSLDVIKILLESGEISPEYRAEALMLIFHRTDGGVIAEMLLKKGCIPPAAGGEALIRAILAGNEGVVKKLIEQKDVSLEFMRKNFMRDPDLIDAIFSRFDVDGAINLLEQELVPSEYRGEALIRASYVMQEDFMDRLLEKNNIPPEVLGTVLSNAVGHGNEYFVYKLLKREDVLQEDKERALVQVIRSWGRDWRSDWMKKLFEREDLSVEYREIMFAEAKRLNIDI